MIRTRFAPSPTGPLHIGGLRTALYNYILAKKFNGKFILRIEDTDKKREIKNAIEYIISSLSWIGIIPDEGYTFGGEYSPYRQSERSKIYKNYCNKLIANKKAYIAFDTEEELNIMREKLKAKGNNSPKYDSISREQMKNSFTLTKQEVEKKIENGEKYVVRLKINRGETIKIYDEIRGWVSFNSNNLDDKIVFKSDGLPTYHLANVVDDYEMKISHVIRGEEWLPSLPIHYLIYKYLGIENKMPKFAHLPLILNPSGKGKLSKRDGDKNGFPVFPLEWTSEESNFMGYKQFGFFPEAVINFLSLLGWNPGNNQELFTLDQLIDKFEIERIGKSGARFDFEKAKWFNQCYLRKKDNKEILHLLEDSFKPIIKKYEKEKSLMIIELIKERAFFLQDIVSESNLFLSLEKYDDKFLSKKNATDFISIIKEIKNILANTSVFKTKEIEENIKEHLKKHNIKIGKVLPILRMGLTGKPSGPSLFKIVEILGKKETDERMNNFIKVLN